MAEFVCRNKIEIHPPISDSYEVKEAYKIFRTNFTFCGDNNRVIALTSCMPNEGKTTLVVSLASCLAEMGKRVLVIDADMRKSHMHTRYACEPYELGLSHYLSGQAELEDVIVETQFESLCMLFAGHYPPNPVELLEGDRFAALLAAARESFDYVLVDTPPIGAVIDAAVVAKNCDGIMMVFAADRVRGRFAKKCIEQLQKSGCPILGAVLNMVPHRSKREYSKYYKRYYGHYYGHYYGTRGPVKK